MQTVDISKNGNHFAHHAHIAAAAELIFKELAAEKYLAKLNSDRFCIRAAYYFGEINALHPFREGNGRTQREFMSHLAQANGLYFAWEETKPSELLQASIESFRGDMSRLTAIFHEALHKQSQD